MRKAKNFNRRNEAIGELLGTNKNRPLTKMELIGNFFGDSIKERNKKLLESYSKTEEYQELKENIIGKYLKCETLTTAELKSYYFKNKEYFLALLQSEAIYFLPTTETINFIKKEIEGFENVIEIGSGNGYLCRLLGITGTDSMCQLDKSIIKAYEDMGQTPIEYKNKDVLKYKDLEAIKTLKPDCIVASWTTVKKKYGDNKVDGFADGVQDHLYILYPHVKKYIFVGHYDIHKSKEIMNFEDMNGILQPLLSKGQGIKIRYERLEGPLGNDICSRRMEDGLNVIVIIEKTDEPGLQIKL
ncbi:hypothetical protein [Cetobacterium sp.]|uniref:hypothetical protein n=1 Tax=Cetobacterium sp. TaxID=2071632 RepID=UPI003F2EB92E